MPVMFEVQGLAELEAKLRELKPTIARKHFRLAMNRGANILLDEARSRAPIRDDGEVKRVKVGVKTGERLPGFLLEDVEIRRGRASAGSVAFKIGTTARAFYARFLEFGTRHQPARPWLRPALDTAAEEAIRAVREYLQRLPVSDIEDGLFERVTTGSAVQALMGTRMYPVLAPQNVTPPFLVYQRVSAPRETAFGADPGMVRARYQLSTYAGDFDTMRAVRAEIRKRVERFRGVAAGVTIDDIFIESDQDLWDAEAQLFYGPLDVLVLYWEAV